MTSNNKSIALYILMAIYVFTTCFIIYKDATYDRYDDAYRSCIDHIKKQLESKGFKVEIKK